MRKGFKPDENVERCLNARRSIERQYKTVDGLIEHLLQLEQTPLPNPKRQRAAGVARRVSKTTRKVQSPSKETRRTVRRAN